MFTVNHSIQWLIQSYMRCLCIYSAHRASSPSQQFDSNTNLTETQIISLSGSGMLVGFCGVFVLKMTFQHNKWAHCGLICDSLFIVQTVRICLCLSSLRKEQHIRKIELILALGDFMLLQN